MLYRTLGRTSLKVSEIGYGAWGIGQVQWLGGSDDESLLALRRAIELGVNFIDTALAYGDGHSEQLVGNLLREIKSKVFIATKIPPKNRVWPARAGTPLSEVFPREYCMQSTEESLRNLKVEQIDLQQFHVWNAEWVDQDEWRRTAEDLKASGKVAHFGVSLTEHDPDSGVGIVGTGLVDVVQVIYNIFDPTAAVNLFPLCAQHNTGVIARVPLDEGGLTGSVTEQTVFDPSDFRAGYFKDNRKKEVEEHVAALKKDLEGVDGTLAETALRFCLAHSAVATVIPGMRRIKTAESSCGVSGKAPLPEDTLACLKSHAWARNFYN